MEKIADRGTIQGMEEVPEDVQRVFVTAHDISPEYHIRMQAAFQNIRITPYPRRLTLLTMQQ